MGTGWQSMSALARVQEKTTVDLSGAVTRPMPSTYDEKAAAWCLVMKV
jgi:hypothetical protein